MALSTVFSILNSFLMISIIAAFIMFIRDHKKDSQK